MRAAVIGTEAGGGGAGRAMRRSAAALTHRGHDIDILHIDKHRITPQSVLIEQSPADIGDPARDRLLRHLKQAYLEPRRSALSDTLFSHDLCGYDLSRLSFLASYDVINIHWTSYFLSIEAIGDIVRLGRPVVFSLHDMAYFTGGCHYSAGCQRYLTQCLDCPQINPDTLQLARRAQDLKRVLFNQPNVAVVAPSKWLARCAASSSVFAGRPCRHISNPIETDVFRPLDRQAARAALGLGPDDRALLFGAYHGRERRKGFRHLIAAVETLRADPRAAGDFARGRVKVLTFGSPPDELAQVDLPIVPLGFIHDDAALARIYNAADVLVLPSIEDNQPNVMIEAMACGAPVVAFDVGGIPEWVINGETGFAAPPFDVRAMARSIGDILFDDALAARLRECAASKVKRECSLDTVGRQIESMFRELCEPVGPAAQSAPAPRNEDGRRAVAVRLHYAARLDEFAARLPPAIEPALQAVPPPPQPAPEPPPVGAFEAFHAARARLLAELRAAPEGQLRAAYRITRRPGDHLGRTGFAALVLNIVGSYRWNLGTVLGALRRVPGYSLALLRSFGRKPTTPNAAQ
jgi:glycosyltransferase involved in cell wall biosynthesis